METKELIQAIINYRGRNGVTQKEFAKKLGITPANLCRIETGKTKKVQPITLYKIMSILNSEVL